MFETSPADTPENKASLRTMRPSDLDLVVRNETLSYPQPWSKRIFSDCLRAGYECWVLATDDAILAHGVLSMGPEESHLLTLCVHPDYRRQGHAKTMLRHLLDKAAEQGAKVCFLEVRPSNRQARNLYYSMGFVQVGERRNYYPASSGVSDREDALILSCLLPLGR